MKIGSLFAGIGGFDLGFERAGFESAFVCEIDRAAQSVLRRRFPRAMLFDDVRTIGAHNLPAIDVLTFGSPCQDLSVAGKRAGLAGERSGLFHEAMRIVRELRDRDGGPDFAIWENVPGAFSSNEGRDFAAVVQAMVDIGARDICWRVLDSRYFGVAQRRRRVFLVADFGGERAEQILFEPESLRGDIAKGGKARKEAPAGTGAGARGGGESFRILRSDEYRADTVASTVAARDYKSATDLVVPFGTTQITSPSNYSSPKAGDPRHPLAAGAHPPAVAFAQPITFHPTQDPISSQNGISHAMSNGSKAGQATVAVCATDLVTQPIACDGSTDGVVPPLMARSSRGGAQTLSPGHQTDGHCVAVPQPIAFHPTQDPISSEDGVSHAMSSGNRQGCGTVAVCTTGEVTHALRAEGYDASEDGTDRGAPITVRPPMQVRRLTPTECERLQGFPDGWTTEGVDDRGTVKQQADGPRYKQLGNAVTVNVVEWIARRLRQACKVEP